MPVLVLFVFFELLSPLTWDINLEPNRLDVEMNESFIVQHKSIFWRAGGSSGGCCWGYKLKFAQVCSCYGLKEVGKEEKK
jgi:hypothetical protein